MQFPMVLDRDDMALLLKECVLGGCTLRTNVPQRQILREHLGSDADRLAQGYDDILVLDGQRMLAEYWLLREKWCRPSATDMDERVRWIFPSR